MITRRIVASLIAVAFAGALTPQPAAAAPGRSSTIRGVTAITQVYTYGQKVVAVAVEYPAVVDPRTLGRDTFTVSDSIYNFRYNPIEDLAKRADRTVVRVYTNSSPALNANGRSTPGRFVIVELAPADPGGNTVIVSKCPTALCSVKVNPNLPTEVVQRKDIRTLWGKVTGAPAAHPLTGRTVNRLVDEFTLDTFTGGGTALPYAYHLPRHYDRHREYPLVVILPGHGMGWDGDNPGVQIAADIPATAWLRPNWREDVIVLAPQNQRVGAPAEAADMVALVERFTATHRVDRDRVYVSTVSYGSTLAWEAMATHPGLFTAALITGGFRVSAEQAARIATDRTPIWITHGLNDHLLPVAYGRDSTALLRTAYTAAGVGSDKAADLVRYTEFGNDAFSEPDYHAAFGPTYENRSILRWLVSRH
ncbi:PHB depolymerase family esterase [Actinophytocola sp.]|uniref:PHB depolymerase family esterase n=1 Tax=Actinophytocola sp. TaxID=1872138 RepID=UPI002D5D5D42|nr:PHB depolymerase family esterase [Actinophytocola sp.]HYQ64846.1 PHB depolymerase family esterase [Actinophytocola sp.]